MGIPPARLEAELRRWLAFWGAITTREDILRVSCLEQCRGSVSVLLQQRRTCEPEPRIGRDTSIAIAVDRVVLEGNHGNRECRGGLRYTLVFLVSTEMQILEITRRLSTSMAQSIRRETYVAVGAPLVTLIESAHARR